VSGLWNFPSLGNSLLGLLLIALTANRFNCFIRKTTINRWCFYERTKVIGLRLNANVGYFAEKRPTGKDQSVKKVQGD